MRKILFFILLAFLTNAVHAKKRAYIPKYTSAILIVNAKDTFFVDNNNAELVATAKDSLFRVAVVHEVFTFNRNQSIKPKDPKNQYSVSSWFSSLNILTTDKNTRLKSKMGDYSSSTLSDIANYNDETEKVLDIDVLLENSSSEELLVNDMEHGMSWYLLPGTTLKIPIENPDIALLRVSDIQNKKVYYVQAGGGSQSKPFDVEWEDENYWAFPLTIDYHGTNKTISYILVSKATGERKQISKKEMKELKEANNN